MISRGNAAAVALGTGGGAEPAALAELEAFEQLKAIVDMLAASSRWVDSECAGGDCADLLAWLGERPAVFGVLWVPH